MSSDIYKVPGQTRIGHVHLKVGDLERSLGFYRDLLGFEVTMMYGDQAAFVSAGECPRLRFERQAYIIRQSYIRRGRIWR